MSLNRVAIAPQPSGGEQQGAKPKHGGSREYDLGAGDLFWNSHKGNKKHIRLTCQYEAVFSYFIVL